MTRTKAFLLAPFQIPYAAEVAIFTPAAVGAAVNGKAGWAALFAFVAGGNFGRMRERQRKAGGG